MIIFVLCTFGLAAAGSTTVPIFTLVFGSSTWSTQRSARASTSGPVLSVSSSGGSKTDLVISVMNTWKKRSMALGDDDELDDDELEDKDEDELDDENLLSASTSTTA
jgi:hypothetical protein